MFFRRAARQRLHRHAARRLLVEPLEDRCLLSASPLDAPSAPPAAADPLFDQDQILISGTQGYTAFRIPAAVVSTSGTVLLFAEGRIASVDDATDKDIVLVRSFDNGLTWQPLQVVVPALAGDSWGNPTPVVDRDTGDILLIYIRNISQVFVVRSSDDGATWSAPVEITSSVKDPAWGFYATGPGHAIQLSSGRILVAAYHRIGGFSTTLPSYSHVFYSDDHGLTWQLGGMIAEAQTNEAMLVETVDGSVYMTMRARVAPQNRWYAWSTDGGLSWSTALRDETLIDPSVQASIVRFTDEQTGELNRILFANPAHTTGRVNMSVRVSYDEALTWSEARTVYFGNSAYSDLVVLADGTVLLFYERGRVNTPGPSPIYQQIALARFNQAWLEADVTYSFRWDFDELTSGAAPGTDGFILDAQGWDLHAQAVSGPTYVAGDPRLGGSALRFTSGPDLVRLAAGDASSMLRFAAADSFTFEVHFRTTAHGSGGSGSAGTLLAGGNAGVAGSWWLQVEDGKLRFGLRDDNLVTVDLFSSVTVNDGNWHHVAVVRDTAAGALRIYVDHQLAGSVADSTGSVTLNSDLAVGRSPLSGRPLTGDIDFVKFTRAALPAGQFVDLTPPQVTGVYVQGTAWSAGYLDFLAAQQLGDAQLGFRLSSGPDQLATLPWINVDRLSITFSEGVRVSAGDLALIGSPQGPAIPSILDFHYDSDTFTATWTFAAPLAANKYLVHLSSAITDLDSAHLDGEWLDAQSTASGDGLAGGDFLFRFNVVPGDVDASRDVTFGEIGTLRSFVGQSVALPTYDYRMDVDGSSSVTFGELASARSLVGTGISLLDDPSPPAEPLWLAASDLLAAPASSSSPEDPSAPSADDVSWLLFDGAAEPIDSSSADGDQPTADQWALASEAVFSDYDDGSAPWRLVVDEGSLAGDELSVGHASDDAPSPSSWDDLLLPLAEAG